VTPSGSTPETLIELIETGQLERFAELAGDLEPPDLADVLALLSDQTRLRAVRALPPEVSAAALAEMPEEAHAEETLAALDTDEAADILEELEDDDAADILGELEPSEQERILAEVEDPTEVERLLRYDEETAGGLMTTHLVTVRDTVTAAEALEEIRRQADEVDDFYQVFVVDRGGRLIGYLPLKSLVVSHLDRPVREIMEDPDITIAPDLDQEEVARVMARYNLPSIPVVAGDGRLLGRVTFDDVDDVVEAETTEDMLKFGGVSADEELGAEWRSAVGSRLPWLTVNLLTAFLASGVVLLFRDVIQAAVVLAAIMPIIAGMGGNAGTQALAVTVRRLALGTIPRGQSLRVIGKETLVAAVNGLVVGVAVAVVTLSLGEGPRLGLLVFIAMTGNVLIAGCAGAFIPILLQRVGVDPAIASSVFVTTITDIFGFLLLLGLAGFILL
jgi:magnesium transporter